MPDETFDLADAAILERTPAVLNGLLRGLPEGWTRATENSNSWSPFDVVGHLVHAERTNWMPRVRHILNGVPGAFQHFDRTAQLKENVGKSMEELLDAFAHERAASLAALHALKISPENLAQTGRHPDLGEVTLAQLLATWVVHDLDHTAQIVRAMARRCVGSAGPWRAVLRSARTAV